MPEEQSWNSFFNIPEIVQWLDLKNVNGPVVEIGCGYGTFTIPVAKGSRYPVHAFDIEFHMIEATRKNVRNAGLSNVDISVRDVIEKGTGLESSSAGMVLLFNILHFDGQRKLLAEASRILQNGGIAAIIHWRKDIETPRGPGIAVRPDQNSILKHITGLDLKFSGNSRILEPYHWGMQLVNVP